MREAASGTGRGLVPHQMSWTWLMPMGRPATMATMEHHARGLPGDRRGVLPRHKLVEKFSYMPV